MKFIFSCVLFIALTPLLHSQTIVNLGANNIFGSVTGLNSTDPNDDESLVFTFNNVTGLPPGQSLRISGIGTRSIGTTEKQYAISAGTSTMDRSGRSKFSKLLTEAKTL